MPTDEELREQQLRDELEHHLELLTSECVRSGLAPAEARRRARIAFGGLEQVKEECRDVRGAFLLRRIGRALTHWFSQRVRVNYWSESSHG